MSTPTRGAIPRLLVLVLSCLAAPGLTLAAPHGPSEGFGSVSGRVIFAESGEPLPHATVLLERLDRKTETDGDGRYVFNRVPAGTQHVIALMGGMADADRLIEVPVGGTATADFSLRFQVLVPEITVTARGREELAFESLSTVTSLEPSQLDTLVQPGLGEVLDQQPGVAKRSFGSPGTSRPIVRGFDGDRVLIMEDGIRTGTLSSQSGDHGELVDVTALERLEVVKGPATLLYGGNAIGGVVNSVSPHHSFRESVHGGFLGGANLMLGSTNDYAGGSGRFELGGGDWNFWGGGGHQRTDDYDTPIGRVPNSHTDVTNVFAGLGRYEETSFLSFGYRYSQSEYGVPFATELHEHGEEEHDEHGDEDEHHEDEHHDDDEDEHEDVEAIAIDARRHVFRFAGGWRELGSIVDRLTVSANYTDWNHVELEDDTPATNFDNRQFIYRATVDQTRRGRWTGTSGIWGAWRDYEVIGEEALAPPVTQNNFAAFTLQELELGRARLQLGARLDHTGYDPDEESRRERSFTGFSGSAGVHVTAWSGGALVANFQSAYRPPALEELYNFGPHPGNAVFEIGDENLGTERSNGIDLSIRHSTRRLRGSFSWFHYDISDFLFLALSGEEEDGLPVGVYTQADSRYRGFEGKLDFEAHPMLVLKGGIDRVEAEIQETGTPLPRIPPLSGSVAAEVRHRGLSVEPELVLAAEQDRIFTGETTTPGYQVLNLNASYSLPIGNAIHRFTLRAFNLTDELYFNHSSFIKERAPEIGRGVRFVYSVRLF